MSERRHLLDNFPLVRASNIEDASRDIGRAFSPHRLTVAEPGATLSARHNQVCLGRTSLNVLSYGAGVTIDPGQRGDFYMVQLPLAGSCWLEGRDDKVAVNPDVLSILQPRGRGRMHWSSDCEMVLLSAPSDLVNRRLGVKALPRVSEFALSRKLSDPVVAAWCQAALDITHNLDRFGSVWLGHQAACAAMEEFLLSAFSLLLQSEGEPSYRIEQVDERCVGKAKEFVHANLDRALTLCEIAEHACVSARTLESAFRRSGEMSPLTYAREQRLSAVHQVLSRVDVEVGVAGVTEVALSYGFAHLGRFAAHYRRRFGCSPSDTLRSRRTSSSSFCRRGVSASAFVAT